MAICTCMQTIDTNISFCNTKKIKALFTIIEIFGGDRNRNDRQLPKGLRPQDIPTTSRNKHYYIRGIRLLEKGVVAFKCVYFNNYIKTTYSSHSIKDYTVGILVHYDTTYTNVMSTYIYLQKSLITWRFCCLELGIISKMFILVDPFSVK